MEVAAGFATVAKQEATLEKYFKSFDQSGDETLSLPEFEKGLIGLNFDLRPGVAKTLFTTYDADGSGCMSYKEFTSAVFGKGPAQKKKAKGIPITVAFSSTLNPTIYAQKFSDVKAKIAEDFSKSSELLWKCLDFNGNGGSTLAEIDKFVKDRYPILNNKPALMRAYKRTCSKKGGGDGDDYVEKKEFWQLLNNLVAYNQLYQAFDDIDTGDDRRVDCEEFIRGVKYLALDLPKEAAVREFQRIDTNGGGQVLFDEFCTWWVDKSQPRK